MSWLGYAVLVLAMAGLTGTCFAFAVKELLRPADPGPLPVPESIGGEATPAGAPAPARPYGQDLLQAPILLRRGIHLPSVAAPLIRVEGSASPPQLPDLKQAAEGEELRLRSLIEQGRPLDELVWALSGASDSACSGLDLLRRAERLGLLPRLPVPLRDWLAPTWLGDLRGWYIGAGTARLHGSLSLPPGSAVPFHLIVTGGVRAGDDVCFHGNSHSSGDVEVGRSSAVHGSIVSTAEVRMGPLSVVRDCIGAGGDVDLGSYCRVGTGASGGVSSGGRVNLQLGTAVRNRVWAGRGVACG